MNKTACVRGLSSRQTRAWLWLGHRRWPIMLGAAGISHFPREGDMATPAAILRPLCVFYRTERVRRPTTMLPLRAIRPDDGWCDAPGHALYNRYIRQPFPASAEHLWRDDRAYDLLAVLDFNIHPRCQGRSSAIFLHLMHDDARPTAGCIAMHEQHLRALLHDLRPGIGIRVAC